MTSETRGSVRSPCRSRKTGAAERFRRLFRTTMPLVLLLVFALACVGGGTRQVQESVNRTKADYEEWLRNTGALPGDMVGMPLIVEPENGATLDAEEFTIKGWSVRAADRSDDPDARARVHVYLMPESYRSTPGATASRFIEGTAEVDEQTGEWELTLPGEKLFRGTTLIGARTEIDGAGSSGLSRISVMSRVGREPAEGAVARERLDLICVLATRGGHTFDGDARQEFERSVGQVRDYFGSSSRGNLEIGEIQWLTAAGGSPLQLAFGGSFGAGDQLASYIDSVLQLPEVEAAVAARVAADKPFTVMVFVPPAADAGAGYAGWSLSWAALGQEYRGSFVHLLDARPSVIAHEIAHGIGTWRRVEQYAPDSGKASSQLPDLYHTSDPRYYGVPVFSNLDMGSQHSNYFLMSALGNFDVLGARWPIPPDFIPTPSAYSQHWLEWLEWERFRPGEDAVTVSVPNLSNTSGDVDTVPVIELYDSPELSSYVVMEARSRGGEHGSASLNPAWWPGDGVVLYEITEWPGGMAPTGSGAIRSARWIKRIDYARTLTTRRPTYIDPARRFKASLSTRVYSGSGESQGVSVQEIPVRPYGSGLFGVPFLGPVLSVPGLDYPSVVDAAGVPRREGPGSGPSGSGTGAPFPDLDLHAYLADGRHIGMDYETGEFENPVPEALVSGDRSLDAEWILLPQELAEGARFEVSSHDTQQVLEYYEGLAADDLVLEYELTPTVFDEYELATAQGAPVSGALGPGESASTWVQADEETLTASPPVADASDGPPSAEGSDEVMGAEGRIVLLLVGATLLVLAGAAVLLWPRRRRRDR